MKKKFVYKFFLLILKQKASFSHARIVELINFRPHILWTNLFVSARPFERHPTCYPLGGRPEKVDLSRRTWRKTSIWIQGSYACWNAEGGGGHDGTARYRSRCLVFLYFEIEKKSMRDPIVSSTQFINV